MRVRVMRELTEQNRVKRVKSSLLAVNPNLRIFLGAMENTAAFLGVIVPGVILNESQLGFHFFITLKRA